MHWQHSQNSPTLHFDAIPTQTQTHLDTYVMRKLGSVILVSALASFDCKMQCNAMHSN